MKENPIILRTGSCAEILPDKKMALRFMGCKELFGDMEEIYEESSEEYKKAAAFKEILILFHGILSFILLMLGSFYVGYTDSSRTISGIYR